MQNAPNQTFLIEAFTELNITLEFVNVSLLMNTTYTTHGLNVLLYKAHLVETNLKIHRLDQQNNTRTVIVTNSTFGTIQVTRGFNIRMSDCYIACPDKDSLMDLIGCNLSIRRSTVYSNKESFSVHTKKCNVDTMDVNFINNYIVFDESTIAHINNTYLNNVNIKLLYSSMHIVDSHFERINTLEIILYSNVTIADTTVKYQGDFNLPFLYSINAQVAILNCTFSKIVSLLNAQYSTVTVDNSRITDIQSVNYTLTDGFIYLFIHSHLVISDTIIRHNKPAAVKTFFTGTLKSHLEMYRCLYERNFFRTHFMADDNSDVTIKESQFINNNSTNAILNVERNKCILDSCLFEDSTGEYLVEVQSSNVTISNCALLNTGKNPEYVVYMESSYLEMNNYLEVDNCTFSGGQRYLVFVTNVADVSIQNSYFQRLHPDSYTVWIDGVYTLRLANSDFYALASQIYLLDIVHSMNFYTLASSFSNKTCSITTNETDFVQKGWYLGFVHLRGSVIHKETGFASSK